MLKDLLMHSNEWARELNVVQGSTSDRGVLLPSKRIDIWMSKILYLTDYFGILGYNFLSIHKCLNIYDTWEQQSTSTSLSVSYDFDVWDYNKLVKKLIIEKVNSYITGVQE